MTSAISRSISMRLSTLSKMRKVPYQNVLTEFMIERLLARLVGDKNLASILIFKGGYVGRRVYGSPRYTVDLDALLNAASISTIQKKIISVIEHDIIDGTWYRFEKTLDLQTQGEYPGVRFVSRCGLGEPLSDLKRAQIINFDVGVGDFAIPVNSSLEPLLEGEAISWNVYSKELIVSEKLHSFLSRPLENSRSKDLFDLMFYLPLCDPSILRNSAKKLLDLGMINCRIMLLVLLKQ